MMISEFGFLVVLAGSVPLGFLIGLWGARRRSVSVRQAWVGILLRTLLVVTPVAACGALLGMYLEWREIDRHVDDMSRRYHLVKTSERLDYTVLTFARDDGAIVAQVNRRAFRPDVLPIVACSGLSGIVAAVTASLTSHVVTRRKERAVGFPMEQAGSLHRPE